MVKQKSTFCKILYHKKCKRRGVRGQKKPNLVNVVCERPLRVNSGMPESEKNEVPVVNLSMNYVV